MPSLMAGGKLTRFVGLDREAGCPPERLGGVRRNDAGCLNWPRLSTRESSYFTGVSGLYGLVVAERRRRPGDLPTDQPAMAP